MKTRLLPLALIVALLLAFGVVAAACGGDGEALTLEEYFQQLEQLNQDVDERVGAIYEATFAEIDEEDFESLPLEEQVEVVKDLANGLLPVFEDFIDAARGLNPPAEVGDLHNDLVTASDDFLEAHQDVTDQIDDVQSQAELEALKALAEGGAAEAAEQRVDEACFALQDVAGENGIAVDLDCGG